MTDLIDYFSVLV